MSTKNNGRRGRFIASAAAAMLLAGGAVTIGAGLHADPGQAPPVNTPAIAISTATTSPGSSLYTPAPAPAAAPAGPVLPPSDPVALDIPSIGVHTPLIQLGKAADGTADVPPGEPGSPAGWYQYSPTPGTEGPSVILGHVNSTLTNVGVFYRLHELAPGTQFSVTRVDHKVAVFQMDRSAEFKKDDFPTLDVYGNTNRAEIRLITCGGYDPSSRLYTENTVVYAHLISTHPA
ncbi:class F sortase [Arthrobacter sp. H14-L1]|uniref:class F sortase n=1 Tax=Arthrobacter sp. H14-L1 TaxID=2996697 RepID=UPI002272001E|nr:class F sortase [Arthrobacter sp. H14-L1]MCY0906250.1 class F sortase [Arthrobacter sp. H14-L1]